MSYVELSLRMDKLEEKIIKLEDQIQKILNRLTWLDTSKHDGMEGL